MFFNVIHGRYLSHQSDIRTLSIDDFQLTEDQRSIHKVALDFAQAKLAPHAGEWDQKEIFPVEAFREAAKLGFGAIYTKPDHGGCGLGRLEASLVYEALATGCPSTSAYLSIHNMCCWVIDRYELSIFCKADLALAMKHRRRNGFQGCPKWIYLLPTA
jgi:hypothetical protein